jgi:hypothetical protein
MLKIDPFLIFWGRIVLPLPLPYGDFAMKCKRLNYYCEDIVIPGPCPCNAVTPPCPNWLICSTTGGECIKKVEMDAWKETITCKRSICWFDENPSRIEEFII